MKKNFIATFLTFCMIALATFLLMEGFEEPKEEIAGIQEEAVLYKVTKVVDGDTIVVEKNNETNRVRMIGIDTPETVHPNKPVECFGLEASDMLRELIEGKEVLLKTDPTQDDIDRYGRLLRYVFLDGVDINHEMIKKGFAFEYTYKVPYLKQSKYKSTQENAQKNSLGLWNKNSCNY
jgi:micrococcal nuclease